MGFDTVDQILAMLAQQGAPQVVINEVQSLRTAEKRIDAEGYLPTRALELKRERRAQAVEAMAARLLALEDDEAKRATVDLELHDRREHERVMAANGHGAIDLDRVKVATSPAELSVLMRDAVAHSPDGARRAWGFIEPRLREMAAREQRHHVIGTASTAFSLLCRWQAEMRTLAQHCPDRAQVSDASGRRQREIRQQVLAIARTVGLDQEVERSARRAALPERPETSIVSGGWFDQFGIRK